MARGGAGGSDAPVLSTRALNRAVLARQLLLDRADLPVARAVEQVAGLQTQYAPSGYVGLWSRLRDFRAETLTAALEDRNVVQATLMRATIHMVSAEDYPLCAAGTRRARQDLWLRGQRGALDGIDMEAVAGRVREQLRGRPRRHAEMLERLAADGFPRTAWVSSGQWVDMVRVPPSGTWARPRADLYGLADDWLDGADASEADGRRHLVRRYLGGFGPASVAEVASWAGLSITAVREVLGHLELVRYRDEQRHELLDLPGMTLPDPATPAPVRFLPTWDATLLVHARRALILPEPYRPRIFSTKTPHSFPTVLVDGAVAGVWRRERDRVDVQLFTDVSRAVRAEIDAEADGLAAFHAAADKTS